jgi:ankyrin repeat protein
VTSLHGQTPLHFACIDGNIDIVKVLLENGVDVNLTNASGQTPLHVACSKGHTDVVQLLIDSGVRVDVDL